MSPSSLREIDTRKDPAVAVTKGAKELVAPAAIGKDDATQTSTEMARVARSYHPWPGPWR